MLFETKWRFFIPAGRSLRGRFRWGRLRARRRWSPRTWHRSGYRTGQPGGGRFLSFWIWRVLDDKNLEVGSKTLDATAFEWMTERSERFFLWPIQIRFRPAAAWNDVVVFGIKNFYFLEVNNYLKGPLVWRETFGMKVIGKWTPAFKVLLPCYLSLFGRGWQTQQRVVRDESRQISIISNL